MRWMARWLVLLGISLLGLAASAMGATTAKDYLLGPNDVVRISVYGQSDLTTETRISEASRITFPLLGEVEVGGMTPAQAEAKIARGLDQGGFVRQPQVLVTVVQFRSRQISVLGQVNRPGRYAIESSSKLSDMLAQAGGINAGGSETIVFVTHRQGRPERYEIDTTAMLQEGKLALDHEVANGDIVYVPRAPVFYIYGEVQRPGAFRLEKDMTVVQALSVGGGLTQRGTDSRIRIKRRAQDGQVETKSVELSDTVQADDVIYVREALF